MNFNDETDKQGIEDAGFLHLSHNKRNNHGYSPNIEFSTFNVSPRVTRVCLRYGIQTVHLMGGR